MIAIDSPLQEVLVRTAMTIDDHFIEARFFMGLPARGRKIAGKHAQDMFFQELPDIVRQSLFDDLLDRKALARHLETVEDA